MVDKEVLLEEITRFYLESRDFNGIPLQKLDSKLELNQDELCKGLTSLIEEENVSIVYGDIHPNPHIRALLDAPKEHQIGNLTPENLKHACAYPLTKHLKRVVDKSKYEGKPFTLMLAHGEPQLAFKAFDLSVLEHYRNDPRYYYSNDDLYGKISISDEYYESEEMPKQDKILLQTFGFCYNSKLDRAVAAFVRYLSDLSPEHQQIWKAKMLRGDYKLHPDYYRSSILGDWAEKIPICKGFVEEIQVINRMAGLMGRAPLFKNDFSEGGVPKEFAFLVRPTLKEFNDFVLLLDKMISENINKEFFQNEIPYEREMARADGKIMVEGRGTLAILQDWIRKYFWADDWKNIDEMFTTFKEVRRKRQKPAHSLDENVFDQKYFHEQRELMIRVYRAIKILRLTLGNHPKVKNGEYEISDYLCSGKIWTR